MFLMAGLAVGRENEKATRLDEFRELIKPQQLSCAWHMGEKGQGEYDVEAREYGHVGRVCMRYGGIDLKMAFVEVECVIVDVHCYDWRTREDIPEVPRNAAVSRGKVQKCYRVTGSARFKMSIDDIGNIDRTHSATLTIGVERLGELFGVAMGIERVENIVLHVYVWNDIILCRNMNLMLT
jgi:hypothetical protein